MLAHLTKRGNDYRNAIQRNGSNCALLATNLAIDMQRLVGSPLSEGRGQATFQVIQNMYRNSSDCKPEVVEIMSAMNEKLTDVSKETMKGAYAGADDSLVGQHNTLNNNFLWRSKSGSANSYAQQLAGQDGKSFVCAYRAASEGWGMQRTLEFMEVGFKAAVEDAERLAKSLDGQSSTTFTNFEKHCGNMDDIPRAGVESLKAQLRSMSGLLNKAKSIYQDKTCEELLMLALVPDTKEPRAWLAITHVILYVERALKAAIPLLNMLHIPHTAGCPNVFTKSARLQQEDADVLERNVHHQQAALGDLTAAFYTHVAGCDVQIAEVKAQAAAREKQFQKQIDELKAMVMASIAARSDEGHMEVDPISTPGISPMASGFFE